MIFSKFVRAADPAGSIFFSILALVTLTLWADPVPKEEKEVVDVTNLLTTS